MNSDACQSELMLNRISGNTLDLRDHPVIAGVLDHGVAIRAAREAVRVHGRAAVGAVHGALRADVRAALQRPLILHVDLVVLVAAHDLPVFIGKIVHKPGVDRGKQAVGHAVLAGTAADQLHIQHAHVLQMAGNALVREVALQLRGHLRVVRRRQKRLDGLQIASGPRLLQADVHIGQLSGKLALAEVRKRADRLERGGVHRLRARGRRARLALLRARADDEQNHDDHRADNDAWRVGIVIIAVAIIAAGIAAAVAVGRSAVIGAAREIAEVGASQREREQEKNRQQTQNPFFHL